VAIPVSTSSSKVLLAGADPDRSGRLAAALAAHGVVPSLAFGREHLVQCLDHDDFDLVVLDLKPTPAKPEADALLPSVAAVVDRTEAPLVALGGTDSVALQLVMHGVHPLPGDGGAEETAIALQTLITRRPVEDSRATLEWGPLTLDLHRRVAMWRGRELPLTKLQFRLLVKLITADGGVVSRDELHYALYDAPAIDDGERVVAHVRRIRDKIEPRPSQPKFLLTVRGEGFRLADSF